MVTYTLHLLGKSKLTRIQTCGEKYTGLSIYGKVDHSVMIVYSVEQNLIDVR